MVGRKKYSIVLLAVIFLLLAGCDEGARDEEAVLAARDAVQVADYTSLAIADAEDQQQKIAAVQSAATAAVEDEMVSVTVEWSTAAQYVVLLSKGEAEATVPIEASFVAQAELDVARAAEMLGQASFLGLSVTDLTDKGQRTAAVQNAAEKMLAGTSVEVDVSLVADDQFSMAMRKDSAHSRIEVVASFVLAKAYQVGDVQFNLHFAEALPYPTGRGDLASAQPEQDIWIGQTAVVYGLWYPVRVWAESNGYVFANAGGEGNAGEIGAAPTESRLEPVTAVSWRDAIVWCNALSEYLGYEPVYSYGGDIIRDATDAEACDGAITEPTDGFRLPSSVEWEMAARYQGNHSSNHALEYPAGSSQYWLPGDHASGAVRDRMYIEETEEVAWFHMNSGERTHPVGLKQSNGLGLYDMSGNVWEWCFDLRGMQRIRRGGSYSTSAFSLQVGQASTGHPFAVFRDQGFRLVRN